MPPPPTEVRRLRPSFAGMIGLACLLFLDLGASRTFGTALTLTLVGVWLVLFLVACRQFMRRPWVVAATPVVGFVVWLAVVLARR
jgi:hypothetical protein